MPPLSALSTNTPLGSSKASFRTHLNYIKCMGKLISNSSLSASLVGTPARRNVDINRFRKLDKVTRQSIKKDIELARQDSAFAVIAAPWFPVKCYYSLYYLESILVHLIDGTVSGFGKGGHAGVRKRIYSLIDAGKLSLGTTELNHVYGLTEIQAFPAISPGLNARYDYWRKTECPNSVAKKIMDYKLHDAKLGRKWNLHTNRGRTEQRQFIANERLMLLDFFYWYRIKANYRDLDYIDFENGITELEVLEYIEAYYAAYRQYRSQLLRGINILI